ncbi:MAG TPA: PA14 domain-containing protein [Methylomirabilota bacterium]|nr:PA14 domain-containing protein [Methylomirabilota bacterium]
MQKTLAAIFAVALCAGGLAAQAAAPANPQGFITAREFIDIQGTAVANLTNNAKFPNNWDFEGHPSLFEWPTINDPTSPPPNDVKNNYGVQILGYFYPDRTGPHVFWLSADDGAALYLSTDANPGNKRQIAIESQWNNPRTWDSSVGDAATRRAVLDAGTPNERYENVSLPINLVAGTPYYIEALMKEGGGGDNLSVAVTSAIAEVPTEPISGSRLSTIDKTLGQVSIVTQPQSTTVVQNTPLTLRVTVNGTPPYEYQWLRNGTEVPDATNWVFRLEKTPSEDNGARYTVRVTGGQGQVTSQAATITVSTDAVAPTIARAVGGSTMNEVTLTFSEAINTNNITTGRFSLSNGLSVQEATVIDERTVYLRTTAQTGGTRYTITVNGITDLAGNAVAAPATAQFSGWVESRGFVLHRFFQGGNIASVKEGTAVPTMVTFEPRAEYPPNGASEGGENYGNELSGWLYPPESGNYIFYLSADDRAELYLSNDADPANAKLIAVEPTWNNPRDWVGVDRRNPDALENRSDTFPETEWPQGNQITLQAGQRYYFRVLHQEGGGGDNVGLNWRLPSATTDPANGTPPIGGQFISILSNPDGSSVTIGTQPTSRTIVENTQTTLSVAATGTTGGSATTSFNYQWQRAAAGGTFTDITGANSATYTTPVLPRGETGVRYRVIVSVPGASATSSEAVITVSSDAIPPTLVSAVQSFGANNQVRVRFSEPVNTTTATANNSYSFNNGITVSGAVIDPNDPSVVILTTSAIAPGSQNTITINNVTDLAGNRITAATTGQIRAQRGVLLVVGNATLNSGDGAIRNRLLGRDYAVEVVQAAASTTEMATGKNLVITSSTVTSGEVADKFKDVAVPVLNWEAALQDNYQMTTDQDTITRGTTGGQTQIAITNPNHQIAAGLSGTVAVSGTSTYSWGVPQGGVQVVATIADNPNRALVYAYDKGAAMLNGFTAPERRVMLFYGDDTASLLNDAGLKILDAAVDWAQGIAPAAQRARLSISQGANGVTLSWTGTGTLQETTSLSSPAWTAAGSQANPQTIQPTGRMRFFRVVSQ